MPAKPKLKATKTSLESILALRALFLQEANCQIRYDARHHRGWTDSYLLEVNNQAVGYGSIAGLNDHDARDCVFEFYIIPAFRNKAGSLFRRLIAASKATHVETQSNEPLLTSMLYEVSSSIKANVVLFEDHAVTHHAIPGAIVRPRDPADRLFKHRAEPEGDYVVELDGAIVATGGFLLHYNKPFADLYMEVIPSQRRRGIGAFLIQELKRHCYRAGRVPAARTDITNIASRATLAKAGMRVCGFMLVGPVTV